MRVVQSPATLCTLCLRAVPSPRTQCNGDYFERQRRGLAFEQRDRQGAVRTLLQRYGVFKRAVGAPRARCEGATFVCKICFWRWCLQYILIIIQVFIK